LTGLPDVIHRRLAKAGLVKSRGDTHTTLKSFIDAYLADRTDIKPITLSHLRNTQKKLIAFFGPDVSLRQINLGDAESFSRHIRTKVCENTRRRICGRAKQFFRAAIKKRILQENPFDGMKCRVQANPERHFDVTRKIYNSLLDSCPDLQWKLLIALVRMGGLRCPSEPLALHWNDINWDTQRIKVHSPKTEHIAGKSSRIIPIFPELKGLLLQAFAQAEPRTDYVITRFRDTSANLRTQFCRIIERAGFTPWPQVFHNMRRTRQNELERQFGQAVACQWIGNSVSVAKEHYLYATDADFEKAINRDAQAAQKAAQYGAELASNDSQAGNAELQNKLDLPSNSTTCENVQVVGMPSWGFEPQLQA